MITNLWKARIWGASPDSLWLVGGTYDTDRARVFRWLGSGWSEVAAPTTSALLAVAGSSDSDVVTVGRQGNVFQWDGGAWAVVGSSTAPAIRSLNGLTLAGPQRWAVGASGVVMNGTQPNWTQDSISTSAVTLNDVHASGTLAVAVGRDALATHTTLVMERTGSSWGSIPSVTSKDLKRVFLLNSQEGFAVGNDGFILHRTAAGWSQEFITGTWHLEALWARAADDVFAGGWGTTLLHRNGAAWSALDLDPLLSGVTIRDVLGFGTSELWLVAESSSDTVVLQLERR